MIDLIQEIRHLKKQKNATILAHYYQDGEIQELADFTGDSLKLARAATKVATDTIVFCGVHFMAETGDFAADQFVHELCGAGPIVGIARQHLIDEFG